MITPRSNPRFLYLAAIAAIFLAIAYLSTTSIPAHSHQYISGLINHNKGPTGDRPSHGTSVDPAALTGDTPLEFTSDASPVEPDTVTDTEASKHSTASDEPEPEEDESGYFPDRWWFQGDIPEELPKFDVPTLRKLAPHNYKGPGHDAFATFYLSRNASMHEPYFLATLQLVYRLLWKTETKSASHPVIVFVAPFVPEEQRAYFEAAGAIVREVVRRPFAPNEDTKSPVAERLKDVFAKLEMWTQTDFTRIAYLDSDAFPLVNIDLLLSTSVVPSQQCKEELMIDPLTIAEKDNQDLCHYTMGATHEFTGMLNAGVMVLRPSESMHTLLMREYHDGHHFDNGFVEQALLSYVFRLDGPFPPTSISDSWNGAALVKDRGDPLFVLHSKIWAELTRMQWPDGYWAKDIWQETWKEMKVFFEDAEYMKMRQEDDRLGKKLHIE